jgi:ATP adenylyltransferase
MKFVWSPWRMKYIRDHNTPKGCIFCNAMKMDDGAENLIVTRSKLAFVILNRYPYTSGHVMVVPYLHVGTLAELDKGTLGEMTELIQQAIKTITKVYEPEGFNIGANLGAVAGAGVADHLHVHIVPRWAGDTNFMTSVADVRVLPEDLSETLERLKAAWPR